jgi:hypothetical protein
MAAMWQQEAMVSKDSHQNKVCQLVLLITVEDR